MKPSELIAYIHSHKGSEGAHAMCLKALARYVRDNALPPQPADARAVAEAVFDDPDWDVLIWESDPRRHLTRADARAIALAVRRYWFTVAERKSQPPADEARRYKPGMAVAVVSRHPQEGHNYVGRLGVVADGQDHDRATWVHFWEDGRVERVSVPNAHLCEAAQDSGLAAEREQEKQ